MTTETLRGQSFDRILGRYSVGRPGGTVFISGGLHGNEPAGALAAKRVMARLAELQLPVRGRVMAVAGNLEALARDERYIDRDLNRVWTRKRIAALRAGASEHIAESKEQREILKLLDEGMRDHGGSFTLLDLHTTSAGGPPFCLLSDTLANRRIAMRMGVPVILGLEECVDGTLLEHVTRLGHRGVVVEGGQHSDPQAVDVHESSIWLTLVAAGALSAHDVPQFQMHSDRLRAVCSGLPRVSEVRYRHAIVSGNGFRMEPGFLGFQEVERGTLLATDKGREIRASETARLLMPLYQSLGEDGFFLIRDVAPTWLKISAVLRALRLGAVVPALPGVRRDPDHPDRILVNRRVARFYTVEVFHLLGFRTRNVEPDRVVFARRRRE